MGVAGSASWNFMKKKTRLNLRRNLHVWCKIVKIKKGGVR